MKRLTDETYWEESWWRGQRPRRLWLYRDFDFETVRLLRQAGRVVGDSRKGEPLRVLEVGAGGSRVLPYLARKSGFRAFGSDFSFAGCRLLRANFALAKVEGGAVCEDLFQSSLPSRAFDIVFSSGLIEHFDDTEAVVREHLRLVSPGGMLVLIVPNLEGVQGRIWRGLAPPLWQRHRVFGPAELAAILQALGLESVRSGYLGSFFIHIGRGPDWEGVRRCPGWLQTAAYGSVRVANGLVSLFFRLCPLRPHTRALSPAFFAAGMTVR